MHMDHVSSQGSGALGSLRRGREVAPTAAPLGSPLGAQPAGPRAEAAGAAGAKASAAAAATGGGLQQLQCASSSAGGVGDASNARSSDLVTLLFRPPSDPVSLARA